MTGAFVPRGSGFGPAVLILIGVLAGGDATAVGPIGTGDDPKTSIQVQGLVDPPVSLSVDELARLPRKTVQVTDHGTPAEFEGVPLHEILRRAGVPLGEQLRGEAMATYVVVRASDGYRAVFALAELDPAFTDRVVLLADRRDGRPMTQPEGPLRIVVPEEKRHGRWVRMVESVTVEQARPAEAPSR